MDLPGLLSYWPLLILIAVLIVNVTFRGVNYWRVRRNGRIVKARVTEIKREVKVGISSDGPRQVYEDYLYATWREPVTQENYTFRVKLHNFSRFQVGEGIPIRVDLRNPTHYFIDYGLFSRDASKVARSKKEVPQEYQQGYRAVAGEPGMVFSAADEIPAASYPEQEMPRQR